MLKNRSIKKISKIFIQNFIHSKSSQKYSFKELFIQSLAHSKNYSFKFSSKYSFKILFIQNPAKIFIQRIYSLKVQPIQKNIHLKFRAAPKTRIFFGKIFEIRVKKGDFRGDLGGFGPVWE